MRPHLTHGTALLLAILVAACRGKSQENPHSTATDASHPFDTQDPEVDTGWPDGGADTDAPDTDSDTTDTCTTDTGDTGAACTRFSAHVEDYYSPCTWCSAGNFLHMVGTVRNECTTSITYRSANNCLISNWSVTGAHHSTSSYAPPCAGASKSWTVAPGETLRDEAVWTQLPADTYELDVTFSDCSTASAAFQTG